MIRHIRDYGMIFLCDERFASPEARSHLPAWMQSSIRVFDSFGPVVKVTTEFYRKAEAKVMNTLQLLTPCESFYQDNYFGFSIQRLLKVVRDHLQGGWRQWIALTF